MATNAVTEREVADNCCSTCTYRRFLVACWGACRRFLFSFLIVCWELCEAGCTVSREAYYDSPHNLGNEEIPQDFEVEDSGRAEEMEILDLEVDENDDGGCTDEPHDCPPAEESSIQTQQVVIEHLAIPELPPVQVIPATPKHEISES